MTQLKQIEALKKAIKYFRSQIEPHDCGWMYTTIDGINIELMFYERKYVPKDDRGPLDLTRQIGELAM